MGVEQFDFALHARAMSEGRAVRAAEHAHVELRDDAVLVSVLAMHGEPGLLWGAAVGRKGDTNPRKVQVCADPRSFSSHVETWRVLGGGLRWAFGEDPPEGWFPQVVVGSTTAWRHLHAGAERMRTVEDADARYAAETVLWLAERREHLGTQAVIVLSEFLDDHYATGDPENEDRLDVWCEWLGVPDNRFTVPVAAPDGTVRRQNVDGVDEARTDSDFDSVRAVGDAKKPRSLYAVMSTSRRAAEEGKPEKAATTAGIAAPVLRKVLIGRFARMVALYRRARKDFPTALPGLGSIREEDGRSWERWRKSRDDGYWVARQDGVLAATLGLMSREHAADAWDRLLVAGDEVAFRRSVHDGRGIRATVRSVAGRSVVIETAQPIVRARPGTELVVRGTDGPVLTVDDLRTDGLNTVILLDCAADGGGPAVGQSVSLVAAPFDWGRAARSRGAAVNRLRQPPWTHVPPDGSPAPAARGGAPEGLLDLVMGRRA